MEELGRLFKADTTFKPIELDPTYKHDKWGTEPRDLIYEYRAYTVSFDGVDDNDGDGTGDKWGIPEWVAYEVKGQADPPTSGPSRPTKWLTIHTLYDEHKPLQMPLTILRMTGVLLTLTVHNSAMIGDTCARN